MSLLSKLHIGQKFGRLTIIKITIQGTSSNNTFVKVKCECGNEKEIKLKNLNIVKSCGCLYFETRKISKNKKHGMRGTSEYNIWRSMRERCNNPKRKDYHNYGGRGIKVCYEWNKSFINFLNDVGTRPSNKHQLDRIDNNLGYEPGNVRWVLPVIQSRNKSNNKIMTINGKSHSVAEWADILGLSRYMLYQRLDAGYTDEEAIKPPLRIRKKKV